MTTLVVGGVLPSVPMRTPFTPPLPTAMWFWGAAETVPGSSTRMRAGELSLLTCGVTSSVELSSISMLSEPGVTFTCCNWLCALDAEAGFAALRWLIHGYGHEITSADVKPGDRIVIGEEQSAGESTANPFMPNFGGKKK